MPDGAHLVFDAPVTDEACFNLWGALIRQMAMDASMPEVQMPERKEGEPESRWRYRWAAARQARLDRSQAISWFAGRHFRDVCWMCGTDPLTVLRDLRREGYDV